MSHQLAQHFIAFNLILRHGTQLKATVTINTRNWSWLIINANLALITVKNALLNQHVLSAMTDFIWKDPFVKTVNINA